MHSAPKIKIAKEREEAESKEMRRLWLIKYRHEKIRNFAQKSVVPTSISMHTAYVSEPSF